MLIEVKGRFPFSPKFRKFRLEIKWNGPFRFGPTGIFGTSFEGAPLWPVLSFRSVRPKCPFPFDKLLSPVPLFWILLTRTINKLAVVWVGCVQPECTVRLGTWNFRNFKLEFLLNGKRLRSLKQMDNIEPEHICYMFIRLFNVQVFAKSRQMQQVGS